MIGVSLTMAGGPAAEHVTDGVQITIGFGQIINDVDLRLSHPGMQQDSFLAAQQHQADAVFDVEMSQGCIPFFHVHKRCITGMLSFLEQSQIHGTITAEAGKKRTFHTIREVVGVVG